MTSIRTITLAAATLIAGLSAGLFSSYFYSVMPGLGASDDRTFVAAMQSINVKILNGWFAVVFVGAPVLAILGAVLVWNTTQPSTRMWVLAGAALCVATVLITMAANVPLNDALAGAGDPDRIANLAEVRQRFETSWVRWNTVRTVTSVAAFGCLVWGLLQHGRAR
jgi:uncharacterized membrane protein